MRRSRVQNLLLIFLLWFLRHNGPVIRAALRGMFAGTALLLCACQIGDQRIHFREQVALGSGQVILVDRNVKAKPFGEIGGPGGWEPTYMSLEIVDEDIQDKPPKWESIAGLLPILLDRDPSTNEWTLLATFYSCQAWYDLGRPKLPYAEFRVRNGAWQRVELSPSWLGRDGNVFTGVRSGGEPAILTLQDKRLRDADPAIAQEYLTIVDDWKTAC